MDLKNRIPVTILTGFLGAGKTTLLNRILRAEHGLRVAVLVNDFGSVNIDSQLVVGIEGESISLANGCICCTIRDDLLETALQMAQQTAAPDHILIETSGVSNPWAVAETFVQPRARRSFRLDGIITVVDPTQALSVPAYTQLMHDQVRAADLVVLSKCDLVNAAQRAAARDRVRALVPRMRVLEAQAEHSHLDLFFGLERETDLFTLLDSDGATPHARVDDHGVGFASWSYATDQPLKRHKLWDALATLPPEIVRAKGIIALADTPQQRSIVHLVGKRITLERGAAWGASPASSRLVLIGIPGALTDSAVQARFDACHARPLMDELRDLLRGWWRELRTTVRQS